MIVNEWQDKTEYIHQHDHAAIAAQIAANWRKDDPLYAAQRAEVLLAIREHDRAWIPLDKKKNRNSQTGKLYSFIDYPLQEKLMAYQQGIRETAAQSAYAGILCSRHYCSFFSGPHEEESIQQFLTEESDRQEQLLAQIPKAEERTLVADLKLLQFCDDVSLYVCMNKPGTSKAEEISWFRNGFRQEFSFAPEGITAVWQGEETVLLTPSPLEAPVQVMIPVYEDGKSQKQERKVVLR